DVAQALSLAALDGRPARERVGEGTAAPGGQGVGGRRPRPPRHARGLVARTRGAAHGTAAVDAGAVRQEAGAVVGARETLHRYLDPRLLEHLPVETPLGRLAPPAASPRGTPAPH